MAENGVSEGQSPSRNTDKVVVIGAGIAGLAAAIKLIHNGLKDVVVLEAQDYVGGRIKGEMFDNKILDMGAMFLHGQVGNPLYEIVKMVGNVIEDGHGEDLIHRPDNFYTSNREKVPFKKVEAFFDFIEDALENIEPYLKEGVSRGDLIEGFYHQFLQDNASTVDEKKKDMYEAAYKWYCFSERINEGTDDLKDVSAWASDQYIDLKGNRFTLIKGGYTTIMKTLKDLVPQGVIRTRMPVVHIDWNNPKNKVLVQCENGETITADHVISTMSLGCLKAVHSSMFKPSLPIPFLNTIQSIEQGAIGKIFLKWDEPFWIRDDLSCEFLWLESHPVVLKKDISKRKTSMGKLWWYDIPGFETVAEHENLLLVWLLPHQAKVVEDLEDKEVKEVLHELVQHFFFDLHIPEPSLICKTKWLNNPYTRGTYSYPKTSYKCSYQKLLSQPLPSPQNPRLLFAGEAYSLDHMTTTHGAFMTGEQQAEKVLQANGTTDCVSIVDVVAATR